MSDQNIKDLEKRLTIALTQEKAKDTLMGLLAGGATKVLLHDETI